MALKSYNTAADSNTELFAEGQTPGSVNNGIRALKADIATDYRDREWTEYGDGNGAGDGSADYSMLYLSATQVAIAGGNFAAAYHVGRAVRITGAASGTSYGTITNVAYDAGDNQTEITVEFSSGSILNESGLRIWVSTLGGDGKALGRGALNSRPIDMDRQQLTQPQLVDLSETRTSLTISSGAVAVNLANGPVQYLKLTESVTSITITGWPPNPQSGTLMLWIQQDGTGNWTVTGWPAATQWMGNAAPTITPTAWALDWVMLSSIDAGVHIGASVTQGAFFSAAVG